MYICIEAQFKSNDFLFFCTSVFFQQNKLNINIIYIQYICIYKYKELWSWKIETGIQFYLYDLREFSLGIHQGCIFTLKLCFNVRYFLHYSLQEPDRLSCLGTEKREEESIATFLLFRELGYLNVRSARWCCHIILLFWQRIFKEKYYQTVKRKMNIDVFLCFSSLSHQLYLNFECLSFLK